MSTFVSTVTWRREPRPLVSEIESAVSARSRQLREAGLHSVMFVPDDAGCSAVLVTTCEDGDAIARIAGELCPDADVRIETVPFDAPAVPVWLGCEDRPARPPRYLNDVLEAVAASA